MSDVHRRERIRARTRDEAKAVALRQIAESGPGGVSINAIGKELGMSGPALYRYFDGRDAMLAEIVADANHELATAVAAAAQVSGDRSPADRVRAVARAYRAWAIEQPHRYLLLFGTHSSPLDLSAIVVEASTAVLRATVGAIGDLRPSGGPGASDLEAQLTARFPQVAATDPAVGAALRLALIGWTRLHGLVSLELLGHLRGMAIDVDALFDAEVEELVRLVRTEPQSDAGS